VRDQHPFVSTGNDGAARANDVYAQARAALARGDTASARGLFVRAKDLDVVRFRAPSALNAIIVRDAAANGATYVPVAERFASAAAGGIPGDDLFLEHLHPNERGATLIAQAFFDAIAARHFFGHAARPDAVRPWSEYARRMELTPFDEQVVRLAVAAVTTRWPFVPVAQQVDYRRSYRPTSLVDSLALAAAAGAPWTPLKLRLADAYMGRGFADSAAAELRGVVRDTPEFAEPWEQLGRALVAAHENDSAAVAFDRALAIAPSASAAAAAGALAVQRKDWSKAIAELNLSLRIQPDDPRVLYQLSLAYALAHDGARAQAVAMRLRAVAPTYPGLGQWLQLLGISH